MSSRSRSPVLRRDVVFPAVLQALCGRAGRILFLSSLVMLLILAMHWTHKDATPLAMVRSMQMRDAALRSKSDAVLRKPPTAAEQTASTVNEVAKVPYKELIDRRPLHVLITSSGENALHCRQILSSYATDHAPFTLIPYNQTDPTSDSADPSNKGMPRIQALHRFFKKNVSIRDNDLLLVIDGQDSIFQLTPTVLKKQYRQVVETGNVRSRVRFGVEKSLQGSRLEVAKFSQTVIFAASKLCQTKDISCAAAPDPPDLFNPIKDQTNREALRAAYRPPKYLHSALFMGPARQVRKIMRDAVERAERSTGPPLSDQTMFATLFAEQELAREKFRRSTRSSLSVFLDKYFTSKGSKDDAWKIRALESVRLNSTVDYELAMGLDYAGDLFHSLSSADIAELAYLKHSPTNNQGPIIPASLRTSKKPFANLMTEDTPVNDPDMQTILVDPHSKSHLRRDFEPGSATEDGFKPWQPPTPNALTPWSAIYLATNTYTRAIPAILYDPSSHPLASAFLDHTWESMWYHPYLHVILEEYKNRGFGGSSNAKARAQLARLITNGMASIQFFANAYGQRTNMHERGGRGGFWTDDGIWNAWGDVCPSMGLEPGVGLAAKAKVKTTRVVQGKVKATRVARRGPDS